MAIFFLDKIYNQDICKSQNVNDNKAFYQFGKNKSIFGPIAEYKYKNKQVDPDSH